jgi:glycosyltransferase involved in cell wall biosynthesis
MRVISISPLPPAKDGIADYAGKLAQAYAACDTTMAAVTTTPDATSSSMPVLGLVSWSPVTWWRTYRRAAGWHADAVHLQHGIATYGPLLPPLWLLVAALRLKGARTLVTHHEVTRDLERLGRVGRAYYRLVSTVTDVVHVHTEASATAVRSVLKVPAGRVLVVPHPVYDLPASTTDPAELRRRHGLVGSTVLLFFGYVHVEKGLRELVEGLARLFERAPHLRGELRLVIAGDVRPRPPAFSRFERADRDYLTGVLSRIEELGLTADVVTTGHVPAGEVGAWFRACDLVALPYTNTEQSGVAQLALAADVPVVATTAGGLAELFAGTLPIFRSLTPDGIADALEEQLGAAAGNGWRLQYAQVRELGSPRRLAVEALARLGSSTAVPPAQRVAV